MAASKMADKFKNMDFNNGFNSMFGAPQYDTEPVDSRVETEIDISMLHPFGYYDEQRQALHCFSPYTQDALEALAEDIKENGVLSPLIVREYTQNEYEVLAGHNRLAASKLAGLEKVPCIVKQVDDEKAVMIMTTTNLMQRDKIPPSEKGWAYRHYLEAKNQQGKRSDLNQTESTDKEKTSEILSKQAGVSKSQIYRFIRLTYLVKGLQEAVDSERISIVAGENLSYLSEQTQTVVHEISVEKCVKLKPENTLQLKQAFGNKDVLFLDVYEFLIGNKRKGVSSKPINVSIQPELYVKYFPDKSVKEVEEIVLTLLEERFG